MASWLDTFGSAGAAVTIAAVFLVTFAIVGGLGYMFLLRGRPPDPSTSTEPRRVSPPDRTDRESAWTAEWSRQLPVFSGPVEEPAGDRWLPRSIDDPIPPDPIVAVRGAAAKAYRWFMIAVGLMGAAGGLALILSHTGANMLALPGGIVLLLGLGALLNGLIPSRSITGWTESLDFRPLLDKVHVQVHQSAPLRLHLTEAQTERAVALIREGLPISDAARTVYPEFDRLDPVARLAMESALQHLARSA